MSRESLTSRENLYRTSSSVSGPRRLETSSSPAALTPSLLLVSRREVRKGNWSSVRTDLGQESI